MFVCKLTLNVDCEFYFELYINEFVILSVMERNFFTVVFITESLWAGVA